MQDRHAAHRFESLDGLRGVFAVAVVVFHAGFASHLFPLPVVRALYLCVDFFFVLSGFVIAYAYADRLTDRDATRGFVLRRIGRVWPLHIAMLAVLIVVECAKLALTRTLGVEQESGMPFTGSTSLYAIVTNIVLLQSFDLHASTTWNYPSWSISAEFGAYLLFALICVLARRWSLWVAAGVVVAATLTIVLVSKTGMDLTYHLGAVRAALGFCLGWLVQAAYRITPSRAGSSVELGLLAVLLGYFSIAGTSALSFVAPFLFAVAIYFFAGGNGVVTRALRSRPLQVLGRLSYSIYMTHAVVLIGIGLAANLAERLLHRTLLVPASEVFGPAFGNARLLVAGGPWAMDLATLAVVLVVIALSTLTYRWIETPGQRIFARLAQSHPAGGARLRTSQGL